MPLSTSAVGTRYQSRNVNIAHRQLLSFAAGIGIDWPELADDARARGIVAFPTYCASLEYNALQGEFEDRKSPLGTDESERARLVHTAQDSIFHAPIRPGERLVTEVTITGIGETRAGASMIARAETSSRDTGELKTTSWISQVLRGGTIDGEPRAIAAPPGAKCRAPEGDIARLLRFPVTRSFPHIYSECSDIWNPIHTERSVALAAGLPDIILQGTATWSLAAREVVDLFCDRNPCRLLRLATRFTRMVVPGEVLTIICYGLQDGIVPIRVVNEAGDSVLKDAFAVIRP